MTAWSWAAVALLLGALAPALLLGSRGSSIDRLVGLELAGSVAVVTLLVMSQAAGQSSYLIVPFVLVLLSFAGTLVFTRLLGPRSG
jgi:multisubunit Na+/H+ antiporter MnhF subunit